MAREVNDFFSIGDLWYVEVARINRLMGELHILESGRLLVALVKRMGLAHALLETRAQQSSGDWKKVAADWRARNGVEIVWKSDSDGE